MTSHVLTLEKAVRKAVFYALEKVGLDGFRKTSMFGSNEKPKWTYEELFDLIKTGDPLVDPDAPHEWVFVVDEGLYIFGHSRSGSYMSDMRIRIAGDKLALSFRDPTPCLEEDKFFGTEWSEEGFFDSYDELVAAAYEA